jgi:hypothetical protein
MPSAGVSGERRSLIKAAPPLARTSYDGNAASRCRSNRLIPAYRLSTRQTDRRNPMALKSVNKTSAAVLHLDAVGLACTTVSSRMETAKRGLRISAEAAAGGRGVEA